MLSPCCIRSAISSAWLCFRSVSSFALERDAVSSPGELRDFGRGVVGEGEGEWSCDPSRGKKVSCYEAVSMLEPHYFIGMIVLNIPVC